MFATLDNAVTLIRATAADNALFDTWALQGSLRQSKALVACSRTKP